MNLALIVMGCIIGCIVGSVIYHMGKITGVKEGRKQALDEIIHREIRSKISDN